MKLLRVLNSTRTDILLRSPCVWLAAVSGNQMIDMLKNP